MFTEKCRNSTSISQVTSGGSLVPLPDQSADPQDEEELLPGVEYNLVLTAPPHESIHCIGVVTTVSEGRTDMPLTDSDWAAMALGDDEDE